MVWSGAKKVQQVLKVANTYENLPLFTREQPDQIHGRVFLIKKISSEVFGLEHGSKKYHHEIFQEVKKRQIHCHQIRRF